MEIYYRDLRPYFNVIDIRERLDYEQGHYLNSINIPYILLLNNPSKYMVKNIKYYLYCYSGNKSKKACDLLRILGYDVVNVIDGYNK